MPPKASKKAEQKKKEKKVEDKTFGLKNKGKSKAVQKYVQTVKANIQGPGRAGDKKAAKEAKRKEEEEMRALFSALVTKKDKEKEEAEKKKKAEEEARKAEQKRLASLTIEERIDEARSKIDRKKGVPVTEETFKKWKEERQKRRDAEALKAAGKKGVGAKGISGRLLFTSNAALFNDDEAAVGDDLSEFVEPPPEDKKEDGEFVDVEMVAEGVEKSLYLEDVDDDLDDLDDD